LIQLETKRAMTLTAEELGTLYAKLKEQEIATQKETKDQ
jgi:hypothetical protein